MAKAICQSNKDIDENLLLGYLFFYNLGEVKISENELQSVFLKNYMDTRYIKKINKADAFRRASSKAKSTVTINYNGDAKKAKIEVDELKTDSAGVVRLLGRKLVDEKNEELSYETIGKVTFDRATNTVITEAMPYYLSEYNYRDTLDDIKDRYKEYTDFHTKDTVRNITNSILKDMQPVNLLASGLAKFIPKDSKITLYSLQGVIRDLTLYGKDCLFEVIPVIDTDEQRGVVQNAAEREIKEDLFNFTQELKEIIVEKKVLTSRTAASYIDKFKDLKEKATSYEALLGTYMGILKQQIVVAIQNVEDSTEETS